MTKKLHNINLDYADQLVFEYLVKSENNLIKDYKGNTDTHKGVLLDLMHCILKYRINPSPFHTEELLEFGALATHIIDGVDVPIKTFEFKYRGYKPDFGYRSFL